MRSVRVSFYFDFEKCLPILFLFVLDILLDFSNLISVFYFVFFAVVVVNFSSPFHNCLISKGATAHIKGNFYI